MTHGGSFVWAKCEETIGKFCCVFVATVEVSITASKYGLLRRVHWWVPHSLLWLSACAIIKCVYSLPHVCTCCIHLSVKVGTVPLNNLKKLTIFGDLISSYRWLWVLLFSGMWRRVAWCRCTEVSDIVAASIIRIVRWMQGFHKLHADVKHRNVDAFALLGCYAA